MSKGKEYFDTLLVEGIERILEKEKNRKGSNARSKASGQSPRSPGPVRLGSYMHEKSQQKKEDGRTTLLHCLMKANQISDSGNGDQGRNLHQQKLLQLKNFVREHIDTEDNFNIFSSMVEALDKTLQQKRNKNDTQRKGSTLEYIQQNSQYFPEQTEQEHKMTYDLISPARIRKVTSNTLPKPGMIIHSSKMIPNQHSILHTDYS